MTDPERIRQILEEAAKKQGATKDQARDAAFNAAAGLRDQAQEATKQPPLQPQQPAQS